MGWPAQAASTRPRAYGLDRIPPSGGLVLAINHLHWIDIPLVGGLSPRNIDFVAKVEAFECPALGRFIRLHGTIAVRRGESDREAVRLMRAGGARRARVGAVRRGDAAEDRPARARRSRAPRWSRSRRTCPVDPGRDLRHAVLEAGQLRAVLDRVRRAAPLRRAAEERPRATRRRRPRSSGASTCSSTGSPTCTRAGARTGLDAAAVTEGAGLIGTVAIVGFPNVGKSTLVNRLTATRAAVVHETQGTTRDRKELVCEWNGKQLPADRHRRRRHRRPRDPITRQIAEQARAAIAEADLVLFVVDARAGVTPGDEELAEILRESHKPVLVLANKIDDPAQERSRSSSTGSASAIRSRSRACTARTPATCSTRSLERLPGSVARARSATDAIRVAILGRPNVGKSSLFNALVGEERTIVADVPGTTRDTIDTVVERRRPHVRARRHRRPAPQAPAAAGHRVLLASCARSRRPSAPTSRSC